MIDFPGALRFDFSVGIKAQEAVTDMTLSGSPVEDPSQLLLGDPGHAQIPSLPRIGSIEYHEIRVNPIFFSSEGFPGLIISNRFGYIP